MTTQVYLMVVITAVALLACALCFLWLWLLFWLVARAARERRDLDRLLPDLEELLREFSEVPFERRGAEESRIQAAMAQARDQLSQARGARRRRYESRVEELQAMAAVAGIYSQPPSV